MGTTSQGIVYPDDSSPIAGLQGDIEALAESVDVAITPQVYSAGDLGISTASGWSIIAYSALRWGPLRIVQGTFERTGGTISSNSAGTISNSQVTNDVPSDWFPNSTVTFAYQVGNSYMGTGFVGSAGAISIRTLHANGQISSGNPIRLTCSYIANQ